MPTQNLHVHVRLQPFGGSSGMASDHEYVAWADEAYTKPLTEEEGRDQGHKGDSPDEALGALIRDLWIGGYLDGPVMFHMDMRTESPDQGPDE